MIEIREQLEKNGLFLTEENFLDKYYFEQNLFDDLENYLKDLFTLTFKDKSLIVICAEFLKNHEYKKIIQLFVDRENELLLETLNINEYFIIYKKNIITENIFSTNINELRIVIDFIFIDLIKFENNHEEIDLVDISYESEYEFKKVIFPTVTLIQFTNVSYDSVEFKIQVEENLKVHIIKKNLKVKKFKDICDKSNLNFIILILDPINNVFIEKMRTEKSSVKLDNLEPNKPYIISIVIQLDKFFSKRSKGFLIYTKFSPFVKNSYYAYGNNNDNRLIINEKNYYNSHSIEDNLSETFSNSFIRKFVKLNNTNVVSCSINKNNSILLLSNGEMVTSSIMTTEKDGEVITEFDRSVIENIKLKSGDPYLINFDKFIRKVSCGINFCIALDVNGNCYSWGINTFGQLGLNLPSNLCVNIPTKLCFDPGMFILDVVSGDFHSLAKIYINDKIKVYSWGLGQGMELIDEHEDYFDINKDLRKSSIPLVININTDNLIKIIANGLNSGIIVYDKKFCINIAYTFGKIGKYHILGFYNEHIDSKNYWMNPTMIETFKNNFSVIDIAFSEEFTLFLVKDILLNKNEIYICGKIYGKSNSKIPIKLNHKLIDDPIGISACKCKALILTNNKSIILYGESDLEENKGDLFNEIGNELELYSKDILQFIIDENNVLLLINP